MTKQTLNLAQFYPENALKISTVTQTEKTFNISLKSVTQSFVCPQCQVESTRYHGTYTRKVQDLPIFGKSVYLDVTAHEYVCDNPMCSVKTMAEEVDGFLGIIVE